MWERERRGEEHTALTNLCGRLDGIGVALTARGRGGLRWRRGHMARGVFVGLGGFRPYHSRPRHRLPPQVPGQRKPAPRSSRHKSGWIVTVRFARGALGDVFRSPCERLGDSSLRSYLYAHHLDRCA